MSALSGAAAGHVQKRKADAVYWSTQLTIGYKTAIRKTGYLDLATANLAPMLHCLWSACVPKSIAPNVDITECYRAALDSLFGDPKRMYKDNLKLRHYAIPYWNPTNQQLNIHALGLRDEEGREIDYVKPQGIVGIPYAYTTGGKYSTLTGVAPQLRPVPKSENKDSVLNDLAPASYVEWISYCAIGVTECCKMPWVWSDAKQSLVCARCKGRYAKS